MTHNELTQTQTNDTDTRHRILGGVALILIGGILMAGRLLDSTGLGYLVLPTLGVLFLGWGILTRTAGLLIPGGVMGGIGLGVLLLAGPFAGRAGDTEGAVFMLSFALGWGLITLLSALFTDETQWWALIPGGIMAAIGGALLFGGFALTLLEFAGTVWPVVLVLAGLWVLLRRR